MERVASWQASARSSQRLRRMVAAGLVCVAWAAWDSAQAQSAQFAAGYPNKPIKVIVPTTPGNGQDIISRLVASRASERLGQQMVVENRPGAGAIVGVTALKNAAPDGYTLGLLTSANTIQPSLMKSMPFDLRRDFTPLTMSYTVPLMMVVPANFPHRTLAEYVQSMRGAANPAFFGTTGLGTTGHLLGEWFKQRANIPLTAVHFKGVPEAATAMVGGNVAMVFSDYTGIQSVVESGRARVLAVGSKERMRQLPNVPTFHDTYPGMEVIGWTGFAGPAGLPGDIAERLATALRAALALPEVRKQISDTGVEPAGNSPAEFANVIATDIRKWAEVVQAAGIKAE